MTTTALPFPQIIDFPSGYLGGRTSENAGQLESLTPAQVRTLCSLYTQDEINALISGIDLSGLVPYTGANANVDLGTNQLLAGTLRVGASTTGWNRASLTAMHPIVNGVSSQAFTSYNYQVGSNNYTYGWNSTDSWAFTASAPDTVLGRAAAGEVGVYQDSLRTTFGTLSASGIKFPTQENWIQNTGFPDYGIGIIAGAGSHRTVFDAYKRTMIGSDAAFAFSSSHTGSGLRWNSGADVLLKRVGVGELGLYQASVPSTATTLGTLHAARLTGLGYGSGSTPAIDFAAGTAGLYYHQSGGIGIKSYGTTDALKIFGSHTEGRQFKATATAATDIGFQVNQVAGHTGNAIEVNSDGGSGGDILNVRNDGLVTNPVGFFAGSTTAGDHVRFTKFSNQLYIDNTVNGGTHEIIFRNHASSHFKMDDSAVTTYRDFLPSSDWAWDLGSSSNRWSEVHAGSYYTDKWRLRNHHLNSGQPTFVDATTGAIERIACAGLTTVYSNHDLNFGTGGTSPSCLEIFSKDTAVSGQNTSFILGYANSQDDTVPIGDSYVRATSANSAAVTNVDGADLYLQGGNAATAGGNGGDVILRPGAAPAGSKGVITWDEGDKIYLPVGTTFHGSGDGSRVFEVDLKDNPGNSQFHITNQGAVWTRREVQSDDYFMAAYTQGFKLQGGWGEYVQIAPDNAVGSGTGIQSPYNVVMKPGWGSNDSYRTYVESGLTINPTAWTASSNPTALSCTPSLTSHPGTSGYWINMTAPGNWGGNNTPHFYANMNGQIGTREQWGNGDIQLGTWCNIAGQFSSGIRFIENSATAGYWKTGSRWTQHGGIRLWGGSDAPTTGIHFTDMVGGIFADAANEIGIRTVGTSGVAQNPNKLNVYGAYTWTNGEQTVDEYERFTIDSKATSNVYTITTEAGGTGSPREMRFVNPDIDNLSAGIHFYADGDSSSNPAVQITRNVTSANSWPTANGLDINITGDGGGQTTSRLLRVRQRGTDLFYIAGSGNSYIHGLNTGGVASSGIVSAGEIHSQPVYANKFGLKVTAHSSQTEDLVRVQNNAASSEYFTINSSGVSTFGSNLLVSGTRDIGASGTPWNNVYANNVHTPVVISGSSVLLFGENLRIGQNIYGYRATTVAPGGGSGATGSYSTVLGWGTAASTTFTQAIGAFAKSDQIGRTTFSAGQGPVHSADFQSGIQNLSQNTTNATQTAMAVPTTGGASTVGCSLPSNHSISIEGQVIATCAADDETAAFKVHAVFQNAGGTVTKLGESISQISNNADAWSVTCNANDTDDRWEILVTGAAGQTIRWGASLQVAEMEHS